MANLTDEIRSSLYALQEPSYRDFQSALVPTVARSTVLGVRVPQLRKLARSLHKHPDIDSFLQNLPHRYYEENLLHGFLLEQIRDYEPCMEAINRFLPHMDNWAVCDGTSPPVFRQYPERLIVQIRQWLCSDHTYTIRYGMIMLMRHFLDERFQPEYPELVAAVSSEEYYVRMMQAWYFATALA